ncbi:MAG: WbqC family protein [Bacteroidota bacterium]
MAEKTGLLDLQYLPCLEYFTCILQYDEIVLEQHEHFIKQTYRNRCKIVEPNKVDILSIPVIGGSGKVRIKDIKIDYDQKWLNRHWRAIRSAYGKAPFYEYFSDEFHDIFFKKPTHLFDLNLQLLTLCLRFLGIKRNIRFSEKYEKIPENEVYDLRSRIHPKKSYKENAFYKPCTYPQVFGKNFAENMSIISWGESLI